MSDDSQLDAIAGQIGDVRVALSDVAGDVRAVLGRLKDHDRTDADHEARLRVVEAYGCKDHGDRIARLERWRWLMTGAAAVAGAGAAEGVRLIAQLAQN